MSWTKNGYIYWQVTSYEIISVSPCTDMFAVYALESESEPGQHVLTSEPIYFIGVARVEEVTLRKLESASPGTPGEPCGEKHVRNEIVGLELSDGSFEIWNQCGNFAGLCRAGDDIRRATGCLDHHQYPLAAESEIP